MPKLFAVAGWTIFEFPEKYDNLKIYVAPSLNINIMFWQQAQKFDVYEKYPTFFDQYAVWVVKD